MKAKVSVGILTFNHERFIEKCIRSVLSLNYENLEIVISDDCSTDQTFEIVKTTAENINSPHQIIINKNENNLGLADNFNKVFYTLATGDFLITLGGDDMIKEDYIESALSNFTRDPQLMMLDFNADIINEFDQVVKPATSLGYNIRYGALQNYLALEPIVSFAPGRMIKNDLVRNFQPISSNCPTEDSVLLVRALLMGKYARLNKDVILYRRHSNNISSEINLRKLSNTSIIAQYLKDAISLYDRNIISDRLLLQLFKRFDYEYKRREIVYSDLSKYV